MIYKLYFRTPFIPYLEENKVICETKEEVEEAIENAKGFTEYLLIGYDENKEPYTSIGKIDKPLVKTLSKQNKNRKR